MKTLHKFWSRMLACAAAAVLALSLLAFGGIGVWQGAFAEDTTSAVVIGIYSRPQADWVNFAIETKVDTYGNANGQFNGLTDYSWYGKTFAYSMLINGKRVSEWPMGQIDIHLNIPGWDTGLRNLDGSVFEEADKHPDLNKNVYYFGFSENNLNFSGDGYDVFTILTSFPSDSPANYRAETQYPESDAGRNEIKETNIGLASEINLQVVPEEDGTYSFELLPEGTRILKSKDVAMFNEEALNAEGTNFANGEVVDVTYEGNTDQNALTFKTDNTGTVAVSLDPAYSVDMTGEGWNALDPNVQVGCQRAIEFWVYSPDLYNDAALLSGGGDLEVSNGGTFDAANEFQWFMSDIFANGSYQRGVWNHFVFKFREPSHSANGATTDSTVFEGMNWFRFYMGVNEELSESTLGSIYFSNIRLIQTPAQSAQVIETARVVQYLAPAVAESPAVGGEAVEINPNITTRLLNTPGQEASAVTYEIIGGDTDSFSIEGNKIKATAEGQVTVRATLAGDDRYAPATAEFTVFSRKAQQADLTINSSAEGTYGTAYTLSISGGSSQGAVTYEVVSGPATVDGSSLTFTSSGTVVVRATMAGNDEYEAVTSEPFTITVAKASIAVRVTDRQVIANTSLPSAYSYEIVSGSLVSGDVITLNYSTDADITTPGEYTITATAAASDKYDITVQNGKLTVTAEGGTQEPSGDEGGCSSSIAWSGSIASVALLGCAAAIVVCVRKKDSK